mmetsp:Transcript_19223/g.31935  ORF Transcript_19223/g.31935 Transcript_19223/m.31935 type:complete len:672 (+) Transcript_19223:133-2148(+)
MSEEEVVVDTAAEEEPAIAQMEDLLIDNSQPLEDNVAPAAAASVDESETFATEPVEPEEAVAENQVEEEEEEDAIASTQEETLVAAEEESAVEEEIAVEVKEEEQDVYIVEDIDEDEAVEEVKVEKDVVVAEDEAVLDEKKKDNPLEAVGSWFQGLVKKDGQELRQRNNDVENPDVVSEEQPKVEFDNHPDDHDSIKKKGGMRQQIGTYIGTVMASKKKVEPVEAHADADADAEEGVKKTGDETKKEAVGMGQKITALWGRSVSSTPKVDEKSRDLVDATEKTFGDDDENAKKKGAWFLQCSTFFGTRQGKHTLIVFALLVIMFCFVGAVATAANDTMGTFLKNAGRVEQSLQAQMIKHPAYEGELYPFGKITLRYDTDSLFLVNFRMEGLEETCDGCKWSIVEGGTCHDAAELGDTLFFDRSNTDIVTSANADPYTITHYSSTEGISESSQTSYNGFNLEATINRSVILFAQDGSPLACGVLKKHGHPMTYPKLWSNIRQLPGYNGEIEGKVRVDFYPDNAFHVGFNVKGLPVDCPMCEVAILEGKSCNDALGEHFWRYEKVFVDPWVSASGAWFSTDNVGTTSRVGFYLYDGYDYSEHMDRVIVFKDQHGYAAGCGELRDSSNYVWKETEAAIGGMVQNGFPNPIVAGVEAVQLVENAAAGGGEQVDSV